LKIDRLYRNQSCPLTNYARVRI